MAARVSFKISPNASVVVGRIADQASYRAAQALRGRAMSNIRSLGRIDTGKMINLLQVRKPMPGGQGGYSRGLYKTDVHEVLAEIGYDLSYLRLSDNTSTTIHSVRAFLGYKAKFSKTATIDASVVPRGPVQISAQLWDGSSVIATASSSVAIGKTGTRNRLEAIQSARANGWL